MSITFEVAPKSDIALIALIAKREDSGQVDDDDLVLAVVVTAGHLQTLQYSHDFWEENKPWGRSTTSIPLPYREHISTALLVSLILLRNILAALFVVSLGVSFAECSTILLPLTLRWI
jgi:hypothetical protein